MIVCFIRIAIHLAGFIKLIIKSHHNPNAQLTKNINRATERDKIIVYHREKRAKRVQYQSTARRINEEAKVVIFTAKCKNRNT